MPFLGIISGNFMNFQNFMEAELLDLVLWNFLWINGRLYAFRWNQSEFFKMNTIGTLKVLLVSLAFEHRVEWPATSHLKDLCRAFEWSWIFCHLGLLFGKNKRNKLFRFFFCYRYMYDGRLYQNGRKYCPCFAISWNLKPPQTQKIAKIQQTFIFELPGWYNIAFHSACSVRVCVKSIYCN